ncbi:MAG TPA: SRPBCC domain-containing protein [Pseudonocardiaceae bacterium]|nr:SRPBCC domain-containing protein [Pseudonocardiaceae bacterium]
MGRTDSAIRTETFYRHPPARVWRAITDPDALAAWLMPNDFVAELGHKFTFRTQPVPPYFDGIVHCEVIQLDPEKTLAYTWRGMPGMDTVMRWELTPTERDGVAGTVLVGIHSGFDLTNEVHLRAFRSMSGGWGGAISDRLDDVLTQLGNS